MAEDKKAEKKKESFHVRQLKARLKTVEAKMKERIPNLPEEAQEQAQVFAETQAADLRKLIAKAAK